MALRDQPYLPLYVQDFLTDEKLAECSAAATGVYIRLMCIMHKSDQYGKFFLKAKYKQNKSKTQALAFSLSRHMPFSQEEIILALSELLDNEVIFLDGDYLFQKRMVRDGEISEKRSKSGSIGGKKVKNSHTRKLYNESGYIYIIKDESVTNVFKIGISKDPKQRLLQLSRKMNKPLKLLFSEACDDMGVLEDNVLCYFNDNRDGEWITGVPIEKITDYIQKQNLSKIKANSENEYEYENINSIKDKGGMGEKGFNPFPKAEDFNELPETKIGSVQLLIKITKQVDISTDQIIGMWAIFKNQELNGKKFYQSESDVYSHFINWMKFQKFTNNGSKSSTSSEQRAKSNSKSAGAYQLLEQLKKENGYT